MAMKERLLQYIWQFQYFNKSGLTTVDGEPLQIIFAGMPNINQGPDFLSAKIRTGTTTWAGNIELHINSSDWDLHRHSADDNYTNLILHVVWCYDREIKDAAGNTLPTLELQCRVSRLLLSRYEELMNVSFFIPCAKQIHQVNELAFANWKQRLLIERLQRKVAVIFDYLGENNFHWEEVFWWILARNFGIKINGEAFERIARAVPLNVLAKHKNRIHQLEALLLGQGGLLQRQFTNDYAVMLQKEFFFLAKKYQLVSPEVRLFFLRMRPANFPTIRLAQLARLVHNSHHLFSVIREAADINTIKKLLNVTANEYWDHHYMLDEPTSFKKKNTGEQMVNNILVNTIVPIVFAYGQYYNEQAYKNKAIGWLQEISAEKNIITKGFETLDIANKNSFDSQSLIELKNAYCNKKRCLECTVGNAIFKSFA